MKKKNTCYRCLDEKEINREGGISVIMLFLSIKASLSDNIKCIYPEDSEGAPAQYTFDVVCTHCREEHGSSIMIDRFEKSEIPGSRGEASFVMKCKFCGSDCSINLSPFEEALYNGTEENLSALDKNKEVRKKHDLRNVPVESSILLQLDCRSCEVVRFHPDNLTFTAELVSGKKLSFQLEDGTEWYDYDDDANEEVTVTDFEGTIFKGK